MPLPPSPPLPSPCVQSLRRQQFKSGCDAIFLPRVCPPAMYSCSDYNNCPPSWRRSMERVSYGWTKRKGGRLMRHRKQWRNRSFHVRIGREVEEGQQNHHNSPLSVAH